MFKTQMRSRASRMSFCAVSGIVFLATFAACGGGFLDDGNGQADHLTCETTCKPSSSLAINQIRPSFVVVSDGTRVQAQAGMSSGSDLRFNVEIDGSDRLRLVTPQGMQDFYIPARSAWTFIVDALLSLVVGAKPYLSDVTPSAGAAQMKFQFVRGATEYNSSVVLPAPYQIVSPANAATVPVKARALSVILTSAVVATDNGAEFKCTDDNGNTARGSVQLQVVSGSLLTQSTGVSYSLDIGTAIDGLDFSTTYPRGAVARCDLVLKLTVQTQGQADSRFESARVFAQQIRSVAVVMQ